MTNYPRPSSLSPSPLSTQLARISVSSLSAAEGQQVCDLAAAYLSKRLVGKSFLTSSDSAALYLRAHLALDARETFGAILLANNHRILSFTDLFHGTIDGCSVHPRVVVKAALDGATAAVILYHNHPSGNLNPSLSDRTITNSLKAALALIEVPVLDHLLVSSEGYVSFAEQGWI